MCSAGFCILIFFSMLCFWNVSWDHQVISHKLWLMIPLKAVCCAPLENQTILQAKAAYTKYDVFAKNVPFHL